MHWTQGTTKLALRLICCATLLSMAWHAQAQSIPDLLPLEQVPDNSWTAQPSTPAVPGTGQALARASEVARAQPEVFEIRPQDIHLRGVIQRWARETGWVFEAQHWTLQRDIPLAGRAAFESNDFRMAVRWLMRSTLQTDLPAQGCFYSNHVVRVISLQESCARNLSQE